LNVISTIPEIFLNRSASKYMHPLDHQQTTIAISISRTNGRTWIVVEVARICLF